MNKVEVGSVIELFVSQKEEPKRLEQASLILDHKGVINDKFYAKDVLRSILLTSLFSYDLAEENSIVMHHGDLGENIIIDFNPYNLKPEDILIIGEVELTLSQNCTLCKGLSKINSKLPKLLKEGRGIFVKAITNGRVKKGDKVFLLSK